MLEICVRSGRGSEKLNSHSNLAEISSATTLSDDKEKQAAPCAIYQTVRFSLANLTEPDTLKRCSSGGEARKFALPSFKLQSAMWR